MTVPLPPHVIVHAFNHNPLMASSAAACGGRGWRGPLPDVTCPRCLRVVLPRVRDWDAMPSAYYDAYCAAAHMLQSTRIAARFWWALGVEPDEAGAWARLDFKPQQGWFWLCRNVTPERAAQMRDAGKLADLFREAAQPPEASEGG